MREVDAILDRIKTLKGLKSDVELASIFDVARSTVSNWRQRGSIPYKEIVSLCEHENIDLADVFIGEETEIQRGPSVGWTFSPHNSRDALEWVKKQLAQAIPDRVVIIRYEPASGDGGGDLNGLIFVSKEGLFSMSGAVTRSGYKGGGPMYFAKVLALLASGNIRTWLAEYRDTAESLDKLDLSTLIPPENAQPFDLKEEIKRIGYENELPEESFSGRDATPDRGSEATASEPYGEYVHIPQVTGEISAGGGLIADNTVELRIAFRREWIERKGDHSKMSITRVKGDSMEPTLMSGDIVLIDHSRNYVDPHGGIYAIAFENEIMVKRVQILFPANQLRVISDNPKYQPADVDPSTVNINGKVIWFGRELER